MNIISQTITAITDKVAELKDTYIEGDQALVDSRLAICGTCDQYKINICGQCGCFMPIKAKIKAVGCPINKW